MKAGERFSQAARLRLREEIEAAGGNEVFAVCRLDEEGLVCEVVVAARGSKTSVPALAPYLERGDVLVHNHPSGLLEPSDADLAVASKVGENGIGSYIVDNALRRVYVVAEPLRPKRSVLLDGQALAAMLDEGGPLAARIPCYEVRSSQIAMLGLVARAFNEDSICVAEAGTGVGKSFAYILPALAWARDNEERVVLSTATITLQEQLFNKDIPAVNAVLDRPVKACLVKGRANYLCRARLAEALEEEGILAEAPESPLGRIAAWAAASPSGAKSDLGFMPEEALWSRVCSEADFCLNLRCPRRDDCFVLAMRKEAAASRVLVVNHHLLFSDLSARLAGAGYENSAVLPPFTRLVLDEAHAMESSATSFFSYELNRFAVFKQLARLYRERRGRRFGSLIQLQALGLLGDGALKSCPDRIKAARAAVAEADEAALAFMGAESTFRLTTEAQGLHSGVLEPLARLERSIQALLEALQDALEGLPEDRADEASAYETRAIMRRLSAFASLCSLFARWEERPEQVFWLSRDRSSSREAFVTFYVTPVNVSGMMREAVYAPLRSVICTSATLTAGGSFDYWKSRVGLLEDVERPLLEGVFPSPFPYRSRVILGVPEDAPMPTEEGHQAFVNRAIRSILELSGGHALVLFTSYESLRAAYEETRPALEAMGISCMRQGQDDRGRLLRDFKTDPSSVLFATDSFWEGVDAPGEACKVVIIAKLPFRVPTDPVQKARAEAIEKAGGDAFMDMSLPEAVMRLKQGFGRLIRRSSDSGAVVILDPRLLKKRYGRVFLDSLPETRRSFKPLASVLEDLEAFLYP